MAVDIYQANVSLLLHCDGTNGSTVFTDSSRIGNVMTPAGNAAISTSIFKFGTGAYSPGAGFNNGLSTPNVASGPLDLATGDFTVEFWFYSPSADSNTQIVLGSAVNGVSGFWMQMVNPASTMAAHIFAGGVDVPVTHGTVITKDVWHHCALVRSGTQFQIYLDGIGAAGPSTSAASLGTPPAFFYVGYHPAIGSDSCPVDDVRVTKGIARYTSNFTPPTAPFFVLPARSTTYPTSIVDPNYWSDSSSTVPPAIYSAANHNYGFTASVGSTAEIFYIGDYANRLPTYMYLDWTLAGNAGRGAISVSYTINGTTYTSVDIGTGVAAGSGTIQIPLAGTTNLSFYVSGSGAATVKLAPRTVDENCTCTDTTNLDTLSNLRTRMMRQLGFSAMVNNPPPGMTELLNEHLYAAQKFLYRKYSELRTKRFFNWQMTPGTRFYCYNSNVEDMAGLHLDPYKSLDYVGVVLTNGAWIPLSEGIPPTVYTMVTKQGIPARYERRQCIEVFPAPNDYYQLVVKGHFGLQAFAADGDYTTIDAEAVFLYALAIAKAQYQKNDAATTAQLAKDYIGQLVAGTHGRNRYVPGTVPTVPAVQPVFLPLVNP